MGERGGTSRFVRVFQVLTAGSALLAVLGACGIPINPPSRPVPRRARMAVVRSLTGTWIGAVTSPAGSTRVTMTLRQSGPFVEGTLEVGGLKRTTSPSQPARIGRSGWFLLTFGERGDEVYVRGRVDGDVDRMFAAVDGGGIDTPSVSFGRR